MYTPEQLQQKTLNELKELGWQLNVLPAGDRRCRQSWIDALVGVNSPLLELLEVSPGVEVEPVQEAIEVQAIEEPIESKFGRIVYPQTTAKSIAQTAENSPGVDRPIENFTEGDQPPNRGDSGRGRLESAIGQTDRNPIVTGCTFSDKFLARYSSPQSQIFHFKSDATGQLSLLDFEVESTDEPPDPDDLDSLDAFQEAIALWDAENPEPLTVSMDSMCEWAPCPEEWYWPKAEILPLKASSMIEPLPTIESSSTCNYFFIPTFDAWCDRQNDKDEPPDTGIFARLPGPKPPKFPSRAIEPADTTKKCFNANRHTTRSTTIAAQTHITHFAAGSSSQSGRAPPGGDAMK